MPLATLHHFVHPQWFEDLGGFEQEANIQHYLQWTELAYRWVAGGVTIPQSTWSVVGCHFTLECCC